MTTLDSATDYVETEKWAYTLHKREIRAVLDYLLRNHFITAGMDEWEISKWVEGRFIGIYDSGDKWAQQYLTDHVANHGGNIPGWLEIDWSETYASITAQDVEHEYIAVPGSTRIVVISNNA